MDIESSNCNYDQVAIYNSTGLPEHSYTKTDVIQRFCGPAGKGTVYEALGDEIYVSFGSDGGNVARGFSLAYELIAGTYDKEYLSRRNKPKRVWSPSGSPVKGRGGHGRA